MKKFLIAILMVVMAVAGIVWAADVKISDMKSARPTYDDYVPYVDVSGMTNRRTTFSDAIINASGLTDGMLQVASGGSMQVVALISGNTIDWTSGASLPYLAMFPVTAGTSSYVLTSRGGGGVNPIWTNAPAGGSSSNVFASGVSTSGITIYHNLTDFDKTPLFISTDHDNTSGISIYTTVHNGKIGITLYSDAAEWQIKSDGADGGTLKFIRNGVEAFELDATTLTTSGMISAGGNISGASIYSYATNSIGGLYLYTKSIVGKYALIKVRGDQAGDYILTLPADDGNASEYLQTDGDGNLSWSAAGAGDVTKAMLDAHTNDGAFSGTSNFALKAALTASTLTLSGVSGEATKTELDNHTNDGAFSGTSNFALKSALTASNEAVAFSGTTGFALKTALTASTDANIISGTSINWSGTTLVNLTNFPDSDGGVSSYVLTAKGPGVQPIWTNAPSGTGTGSGTVTASSEIGLAMYNVAGSAVTGFVSGTSGAVLLSAGSGTTPVWGTELGMSIATNQAWEKNRVAIFDASGVLSGATNLQYSGVSNQLDLSGVSLVIQSGTSPTGICATGQIYLDTNADTDGQLYSCVATGQWKDVDDDAGSAGEVTKAMLDVHTNDHAVSGVSLFDSYVNYMLIHNGAEVWEALPVIGDVGSTYMDGLGINMAVSGLTAAHVALAAHTALNAISGTSLDWTSGVTLPYLSGYPSYSGTSSYVLTSKGVNSTPIWNPVDKMWQSGTTAPYVSGITTHVQLRLNAINNQLNSGATLETVATSTVAGKLFYDATGPQVGIYSATPSGNTEWVVSAVTDSISFVISGVTHGKDNLTPWGAKYTGQDDMILWKPPYNIVLKEVLGITDSGATVIWNLGNCDSAGANCVQMLTNNIASGSTGNMNATDYYSFANSDVTGYQTVRLNVIWSGVSANNNGWFGSGVTTNFTGTINFWKQRR